MAKSKQKIMPKIKIGMTDVQRKKITLGLSELLADSYMLYIKTHNFHWNVEGPMFNTLHVIFMEQYTELWNSLDLIAERIRSLGEYAPGSYKEFSKLTSIVESGLKKVKTARPTNAVAWMTRARCTK